MAAFCQACLTSGLVSASTHDVFSVKGSVHENVIFPPPTETLTLERTSIGQAVAVFAFLAERLGFLASLVRGKKSECQRLKAKIGWRPSALSNAIVLKPLPAS